MARVLYLDGWRGLAVLAVLIGHFVQVPGINFGRVGVELFFVLSGRLMAEILFVREAHLPTFFWRRFSRVYPALFVLVAALWCASIVRGGGASTVQFLSALTFTYNYAQLVVGRLTYVDHIWSLCIEEHMYLLLGLIAFVDRKKGLPVVAILSALTVAAVVVGAVQTVSGHDHYAVYWRSDVRGASLLMGAIAYLTMHRDRPRYLQSPLIPVVLGVVGIGLNFDIVPDPIKYSLGTAAFATSLMLLPNASPKVLRHIQNPLLLQVGLLSYSLYLWQQPFYALGGGIIARMVHLCLAAIAAFGSYKLVEGQPGDS